MSFIWDRGFVWANSALVLETTFWIFPLPLLLLSCWRFLSFAFLESPPPANQSISKPAVKELYFYWTLFLSMTCALLLVQPSSLPQSPPKTTRSVNSGCDSSLEAGPHPKALMSPCPIRSWPVTAKVLEFACTLKLYWVKFCRLCLWEIGLLDSPEGNSKDDGSCYLYVLP